MIFYPAVKFSIFSPSNSASPFSCGRRRPQNHRTSYSQKNSAKLHLYPPHFYSSPLPQTGNRGGIPVFSKLNLYFATSRIECLNRSNLLECHLITRMFLRSLDLTWNRSAFNLKFIKKHVWLKEINRIIEKSVQVVSLKFCFRESRNLGSISKTFEILPYEYCFRGFL